MTELTSQLGADLPSHAATVAVEGSGTTNLNLATTIESREEFYWDTSDRLINRVTTPNAASPTANIVDVYAHIEPAAVGSIRLDYTYAGPFERWLYDVRDPVGLPIARYEVVYPGGDSTAVWSGAWTPFGELESETDDASIRPPWGFTGQLTLFNPAAPGRDIE